MEVRVHMFSSFFLLLSYVSGEIISPTPGLEGNIR